MQMSSVRLDRTPNQRPRFRSHDLSKKLGRHYFMNVLLPSKSCLIQVLFPNYETKQPKKPPGQCLYKAYDRLEEDFLPITAESGSP